MVFPRMVRTRRTREGGAGVMVWPWRAPRRVVYARGVTGGPFAKGRTRARRVAGASVAGEIAGLPTSTTRGAGTLTAAGVATGLDALHAPMQ
ncbi:MAG: hypothetical protein HOQ12_03930, partial [Gemmatimonadaceae bacterium]|nr:hypothetical protein [Gemmatimonadaceae bacterium]